MTPYSRIKQEVNTDPLRYLAQIIEEMHTLDYSYMKFCWPGFQYALEWLEWRDTLSYDPPCKRNYDHLIPGLIDARLKLENSKPKGIALAKLLKCINKLKLT